MRTLISLTVFQGDKLAPFFVMYVDYEAQLVGTVEYTDCISAEEQDYPNELPGYDTKQSDGEASVILEFWGMRFTPSLSLLTGPPCP